MSRWRCSVDEQAARQQGECERAQEALSRVTSCFQQLAASLGSSADCGFLRDEMDETRVLAHRLCSGTKTCTCLSLTCLSVCLCLTCLSVCRSLCPSVCLSAGLSVSHLSVSLQVSPSVWCTCCQPVTPPPQVWRTGRCWSVCGFSSCLH